MRVLGGRKVAVAMAAGSLLVAVGCQTTSQASLSTSGVRGNGSSAEPALSDDGNVVAFISSATNLVAGDTNGVSDVFVRDRAAGTTTRVSVSSAGAQSNGESGRFDPVAVSGDGRFVAFTSAATNLVAGDTNGLDDVFVHDRQTGATTREAADGTDPVLNDDGRFMAYAAAGRVFVRDRQLGTTEQLPTGTGTTAEEPDLSGDGRFVALTITLDGLTEVWMYDRTIDLIDRLTYKDDYAYAPQISDDGTVVVFGNSGGDEALIVEGGQVTSIPGGPDYQPDISDDGRYVVYRSESDRDLEGGQAVEVDDVFLLDRTTQVVTRVSVGRDGQQANGASGNGVISGDGRYIAFDSAATNLVAGDTNGVRDVFVRDRGAQSTGGAG